jgi:hypothetical protein
LGNAPAVPAARWIGKASAGTGAQPQAYETTRALTLSNDKRGKRLGRLPNPARALSSPTCPQTDARNSPNQNLSAYRSFRCLVHARRTSARSGADDLISARPHVSEPAARSHRLCPEARFPRLRTHSPRRPYREFRRRCHPLCIADLGQGACAGQPMNFEHRRAAHVGRETEFPRPCPRTQHPRHWDARAIHPSDRVTHAAKPRHSSA